MWCHGHLHCTADTPKFRQRKISPPPSNTKLSQEVLQLVHLFLYPHYLWVHGFVGLLQSLRFPCDTESNVLGLLDAPHTRQHVVMSLFIHSRQLPSQGLVTLSSLGERRLDGCHASLHIPPPQIPPGRIPTAAQRSSTALRKPQAQSSTTAGCGTGTGTADASMFGVLGRRHIC